MDENSPNTGSPHWTARMGWRYVAYIEGDSPLSLSIEPMVSEADLVYVPDAPLWLQTAPAWARGRRAEILSRLKAIAWNRKLSWLEQPSCGVSERADRTFPGTLEASFRGMVLESCRMFEPGSKVAPEEAHRLWEEAARDGAKAASGDVNIFVYGVMPGSVFQLIELPELRRNPNVTLNFR